MRRLPFVIWMLCWPLVGVLSNLAEHSEGLNYSEDVRGLSALISLAIWALVAVLLWRDRRGERP
jgi:uncharacterized membrane protein YhaH (DUF805 family)